LTEPAGVWEGRDAVAADDAPAAPPPVPAPAPVEGADDVAGAVLPGLRATGRTGSEDGSSPVVPGVGPGLGLAAAEDDRLEGACNEEGLEGGAGDRVCECVCVCVEGTTRKGSGRRESGSGRSRGVVW
jgi:hypothetical protein